MLEPGKDVTITESPNVDKTDPVSIEDAQNGTGTSSSVRYNPYSTNDGGDKSTKVVNDDGTFGAPAFIFLGHELFHAQEMKYGKDSHNLTGETDPDLDVKAMTESESRARKFEDRIRKEHQVGPRKSPYSK